MTHGPAPAPAGQRDSHYIAVVAGIIIAVAGLAVMLMLGHNYSACQSVAGQIAQQTNTAAQATCTDAAVAHWVGLLALTGGVISFATGLVLLLARSRPQPQPPPPGSGPDVPCARCGAPASAHGPAGCSVCVNCGQPASAHVADKCLPPQRPRSDETW
jgi:hypothetical protein